MGRIIALNKYAICFGCLFTYGNPENAFVRSMIFSPKHHSNEAKKDPLVQFVVFWKFWHICIDIYWHNVRNQQEQSITFNLHSWSQNAEAKISPGKFWAQEE